MALTWLSGHGGVRVQVPDFYGSLDTLQSPQLPVVAAVTPWEWPESFRPNLSVGTSAAAPERCTLEQHLALTIAEQVALGVHVAAVDPWPGPGQEGGFRVIGLYTGLATTVVQLQWVAVRGTTLVTLTLQQDASKYADAQTIFAHAVTSLEVEPGRAYVDPDPATVPRLDEFAARRGERLVDLSRIPVVQPWEAAGPRLSVEQLAGLHQGRFTREDATDALVEADLCTRRGRLSRFGTRLHGLISAPARTVVLEATTGPRGRGTLHAYLGVGDAAVVATPPPGQGGEGFSLGLQPSETVPWSLVRWIGLAPAWTFALSIAPDGALELPRDLVEARLGDAGVPLPRHVVDDAAARWWRSPWTVWTLRGSGDPEGWLLVTTPEAGSVRLDLPEAGPARITPVPSEALLRALLTMTGFEVSAR